MFLTVQGVAFPQNICYRKSENVLFKQHTKIKQFIQNKKRCAMRLKCLFLLRDWRETDVGRVIAARAENKC